MIFHYKYEFKDKVADLNLIKFSWSYIQQLHRLSLNIPLISWTIAFLNGLCLTKYIIANIMYEKQGFIRYWKHIKVVWFLSSSGFNLLAYPELRRMNKRSKIFITLFENEAKACFLMSERKSLCKTKMSHAI